MDILSSFLCGCKLYNLQLHPMKKGAFIEAISESKKLRHDSKRYVSLNEVL
jgi:hypothetical protein